MSDIPTEEVTPEHAAAVEAMLNTAATVVTKAIEYQSFREDGDPALDQAQVICPIVDEVRYVVLVRRAVQDDVAFPETADDGEVPPWVSGNWTPPAET